jgi:hypothetical protein
MNKHSLAVVTKQSPLMQMIIFCRLHDIDCDKNLSSAAGFTVAAGETWTSM